MNIALLCFLLAAEVVPAAAAPAQSGGYPGYDEHAGNLQLDAQKGSGQETTNDYFGPTAPGAAFNIRTLTQIRYGTTMVNGATLQETVTAKANDGFRLNRAFLRAVSKPSENVTVKMLVDFSEFTRKNTKRALKLAFVEMTPHPRVTITAGIMKRPFSLLELLPIADYELAEVGPTDNVIKDLGWGGRDVGAEISFAVLPKKKQLVLMVGAFGGDIQDGFDAKAGKLLVGRIESHPVKHLRLGVDAAWRPTNTYRFNGLPANYDPNTDIGAKTELYAEKGSALSADATFAASGFELRTEWMMGHRTDRGVVEVPMNDYGIMQDAKTFWAVWSLASYRFMFGDFVIIPAARAEWLDANKEKSNGGRLYLSGALNVEFTPSVRLLVDYSWYHVQRGSQSFTDLPQYNPKGDAEDVRINDVNWSALIVQLQVKI